MAVLFVFVILLLLMQIYEQILFSHSFAPIIFIQAAFLWSWGGIYILLVEIWAADRLLGDAAIRAPIYCWWNLLSVTPLRLPL